MKKKRTNIMIPVDLAEEIEKVVGSRKRSSFLVEAAWEKLERIKLADAPGLFLRDTRSTKRDRHWQSTKMKQVLFTSTTHVLSMRLSRKHRHFHSRFLLKNEA